MSQNYPSSSERLTAAHAALEELTQEFVVPCVEAHYLIADLETAIAQAGINEQTHPQIVEYVRTLHCLFEDHALADEDEAPSVAEIVERIRDRRHGFEA
jgi:hypothetical protein